MQRTATAETRARMARPLALFLLALSLAMCVFSVISLVLPADVPIPDQPTPIVFLVAASVMLTYPIVGSIVAIRRPENRIGWLLLILGIGFTLSFFSSEYLGRATISGWPLPAAPWVAWVASWTFALDVAIAFGWIPLLFPTGRVPSPRWLPLAWAIGIVTVLGVTATALEPVDLGVGGVPVPNPVGIPALSGPIGLVSALFMPVMAILGTLSVGSLLLRFRRSAGVERQQLRWFLLATASFVFTLVSAFVIQSVDAFIVALVAAAGIPVAAGIAILRYRLYDIDRLISRTIGWAVVTAVLVAVFVGGVVVLQGLLAPVTRENTLAVAASTLLAFALFQPLRRRVQRVVDHRFDRARYDGQSTTAMFAERVRNEVDLGTLHAELVATAADAVRPTGASLWLRTRRGS
jgi:hypothetical protein